MQCVPTRVVPSSTALLPPGCGHAEALAVSPSLTSAHGKATLDSSQRLERLGASAALGARHALLAPHGVPLLVRAAVYRSRARLQARCRWDVADRHVTRRC